MKLTVISALGAALVALFPHSSRLLRTEQPVSRGSHSVKVILRDGAVLNGSLNGVGCSIAICSRTAFQGVYQSDSIVREEFESLAGIRDATTHAASFVARDGSVQRLTLLQDFRVLYLRDSYGEERRIDLGEVKSVEFTGAAH